MFSSVRASYDLCARAHAQSLEGTLTPTVTLYSISVISRALSDYIPKYIPKYRHQSWGLGGHDPQI